MKILITGAGGFLGFHIAKKLIESDNDVVNFSRNNYKKLEVLGIKTVKGNLENFEDVTNALWDIECVYHVASRVELHGRYKKFYQTNVLGTKNIIRACKLNKVKKLIYTSSPSVVFGMDDLCGVDESYPYPKKFLTHYAKTKSIAEKMVLEANDTELATVSLRPHIIFGPDDPHLIPRILKSAKMGKLKQIGSGKNLVDVTYIDNAVSAHIDVLKVLSINSIVSGQAYFIGQEKPVNLWDFINEILNRSHLPKVSKYISEKTAYNLGAIVEKIASVLNVEPSMSRFIALQFSKSHYFSHEKAFRDFKYQPLVSLEDAMNRTLGNKDVT